MQKLTAREKLHEQVRILLFGEELESEPSCLDMDPIATNDGYELVDGKRARVGRIKTTPP